MKLFVTGGTGFVGSHFLNAALLEGHYIVALRRSPASRPRIPIIGQKKIHWLDKSMFEVEAEDFQGCNVVVHLAAHSANVPYDTLENCIHWNVLAPLALFRKAINAGLKHFLIAGSCFEYGKSADRYEFIPPSAPLEPVQTYPTSKAIASLAFSQLAVDLDLKMCILRIFQVYGDGEQENRLWPSLKKAAFSGQNFEMSSGEQVRDFISVETVANAFIHTLNSYDFVAGYPTIENIGTGNCQTVRQFAEHWWQKWNATGKLKFGVLPHRQDEVMRYVPQISAKFKNKVPPRFCHQ